VSSSRAVPAVPRSSNRPSFPLGELSTTRPRIIPAGGVWRFFYSITAPMKFCPHPFELFTCVKMPFFFPPQCLDLEDAFGVFFFFFAVFLNSPLSLVSLSFLGSSLIDGSFTSDSLQMASRCFLPLFFGFFFAFDVNQKNAAHCP